MGADGPAHPEGGPVSSIYRPTNKGPAKPSPRPFEVKGITSQEAVEFAISYAKQQKALNTQSTFQAKTGPDRTRTASGPEQDKHYHSVTKSQPRQLTAGTPYACNQLRLGDCHLQAVLHADSPFAELETVSDSWTKQSFTGIRALPENLEHGFRQRALYEIVMRGMCSCNTLRSVLPCIKLALHSAFDGKMTCTCNKVSVHHQQTYTCTPSHCITTSVQRFTVCSLLPKQKRMLICTFLLCNVTSQTSQDISVTYTV